MKIVGRYSIAEEAHLAKMKLGSGGIESYLFDEYTIQMQWFYSDAMGGIRLQVKEEDVEKALEILREPAVENGMTWPPCPKCGSENTCPDELPRRLACGSMFLCPYTPWVCVGRQFQCKDCKVSWNADPPHQAGGIKPGPASQFLGAQIMFIGGVVMALYLLSKLPAVLPPFHVLWPSSPTGRDYSVVEAVRESFDYTNMDADIPLIFLFVGTCIFLIGICVFRASKGRLADK